MSIENARLAYPLLVRLARELARAVRERLPTRWVTYDDFCLMCQEVGLKETPRTVSSRVLRPLQAACLGAGQPDLSALVIQKPRGRVDQGQLLRPSDGWWEPYVEAGEAQPGDVDFWFARFRAARDRARLAEAPFF